MRFFYFLLFFSGTFAHAQVGDSISVKEVQRIISILAADSMKGRENYSSSLHSAAQFIGAEFEKDSLGYMPQWNTYFIPFIIKAPLKEQKYQKQQAQNLVNVVGILEGKTKPTEAIIISAHYDHIGMSDDGADRIYNGANDNASGTTALLSLAHYYALRNDNARTLIFCAFSGEELGLFGSQVFSRFIQPDSIKAVINIEMIGVARRKNTFFITGARYSDLEKIMRKNLAAYKYRITGEPGGDLFIRSDNFPFAVKGIPAHSIMVMGDEDPCYHQTCDEWERLDLVNMTNIIRGIALGIQTIVNGTDTPKRINPNHIN